MNWTEVIIKIFEICIYPLLGLTMTYITLYFKSKIANLNKTTQDNTFQANLQILNGIVENCVLSTRQTYVDNLKAAGNFNETAQKMAFKITYDAIMASLTDESKKVLASGIKDLSQYVTDLIVAKILLMK